MLSLGADNVFVLHSLKPYEPLSLTGLSGWLKKCTGFSEVLPPKQSLKNSFEQWMRLLNALGQELSWRQGLPVAECLNNQAHLLAWNSPTWEWQPALLKQNNAMRRFVTCILVYAQAFIESSGTSLVELTASLIAETPELSDNVLPTASSGGQTHTKTLEPEKPKPRFDHKI